MPVDPIPADGIQIETRGAFRSVHHEVPNLSFGSGGSGNSLQKLTCHTSARFRVRAPGPVSGQLYETASGGLAIVVSLSCRLSAAGIRFLGILFPPGNWALLAVGLPAHPKVRRTLTGFPCFTRMRNGWGLGVLCTPETTVSTRSSDVLDRRLPRCNGM